MPGTVLGSLGIPWRHNGIADWTCKRTVVLPNEIVRVKVAPAVFEMARMARGEDMNSIRSEIGNCVQDFHFLKEMESKLYGRYGVHERRGIRRMMARYWNNSSPFALDLVGAVVRQGGFIEKMHNIDWLHSPALPNTMQRLIVKWVALHLSRHFVTSFTDTPHQHRYTRFIRLMKEGVLDHRMAVPTLDVDLAWHTHQLSPHSYMDYTVSITEQFIDHDDKVTETKLNDAFAWTSKTYQKLFGEQYSECTCWYCEAVRESQTTGAGRLFGNSGKQAGARKNDADQQPGKHVHISTHNAVRPTDDKVQNSLYEAKFRELEKYY